MGGWGTAGTPPSSGPWAPSGVWSSPWSPWRRGVEVVLGWGRALLGAGLLGARPGFFLLPPGLLAALPPLQALWQSPLEFP